MRTRTKLGMAVAAIALGLVSQSAKAAVTNGDFSGAPDLTGWSPIGDVSVQGANFNPPAPATTLAALTTITGNSPLGTTSASTSVSTLDTNSGLAAGTLEALTAHSGSIVSQTFNATIGDVLTFKYNFLTNEPVAGFNNDFAYYTLRAQNGTTIVQMLPLANPSGATNLANPAVDPGVYDFLNNGTGRETGNQSGVTTIIGSTGLWTITFGVVNGSGNDLNNSALLVTSVAETAVSVPLPTGAYVAPLGLLMAAGYASKLRRKAVTA